MLNDKQIKQRLKSTLKNDSVMTFKTKEDFDAMLLFLKQNNLNLEASVEYWVNQITGDFRVYLGEQNSKKLQELSVI